MAPAVRWRYDSVSHRTEFLPYYVCRYAECVENCAHRQRELLRNRLEVAARKNHRQPGMLADKQYYTAVSDAKQAPDPIAQPCCGLALDSCYRLKMSKERLSASNDHHWCWFS